LPTSLSILVADLPRGLLSADCFDSRYVRAVIRVADVLGEHSIAHAKIPEPLNLGNVLEADPPGTPLTATRLAHLKCLLAPRGL
jgi:hypothetical protein